ncbi:membrane protein insertase YidC [Candidatus Enterovibrio escicola]|uniref:Membrane protein insertase YidC n=1 Tax=Candidatus Enterovibrio escicola TaxID=1927127 RepID=A0A2A5T526_9GAMM|nr:membrane protein insertase YidC [Candidatus Enterovibrio escacola]PCS23279.1 Inner membrane protein translocase component YidC, long form [Candidatus Enterovibrio escacola]
MDSQRNILLIALMFVSFMLYINWNETTPPQQEDLSVTQQGQYSGDIPSSLEGSQLLMQNSISSKHISIHTDVLTLIVDIQGGDVIRAELENYAAALDSENKFVLLKKDPDHEFIAQSGLIGSNGIDTLNGRAQFATTTSSFFLEDNQEELRVPLILVKDGITYTKVFTLKRGSYAVDVSYIIDNKSDKPTSVQMYTQLKQNLMDDGGSLTMPTYRGGVYSVDDTRYKKYSFDDMQDNNLNLTMTHSGWAAMMQHYFIAAWIPHASGEANLYTRTHKGQGFIGVRYPTTIVVPGTETTLNTTLWVGPKLQDQMTETALYLNLTVDYGWLSVIATPLHWLLSQIHEIVGNWGVAIIILTFIVRGAMYPLTKAQYTSMAKMRMLQPKLVEMRERIGDDRQRMSQEMMTLYKKEKVNPLGGCLPLVLQMPIFIALYWALMESVELRHAPFILWIRDLSAPDPYYVLPLLMGASMFIIQKMSPSTVTDPIQQKIMNFMPIMFTLFFLWFPAGLVLYWLISNIVTLLQQTLIYHSLEKKGLHSRK